MSTAPRNEKETASSAANRLKPGRTSDEAVRQATGRGRKEWFALLDRWGAAGHKHRDIATWIMREHDLDNWWAQTLMVDYEQACGLREPRSRDGTFAITASAAVGVSLKRLYDAFVDPTLRERGCPERQ